jgi:hypothetical protein
VLNSLAVDFFSSSVCFPISLSAHAVPSARSRSVHIASCGAPVLGCSAHHPGLFSLNKRQHCVARLPFFVAALESSFPSTSINPQSCTRPIFVRKGLAAACVCVHCPHLSFQLPFKVCRPLYRKPKRGEEFSLPLDKIFATCIPALFLQAGFHFLTCLFSS